MEILGISDQIKMSLTTLTNRFNPFQSFLNFKKHIFEHLRFAELQHSVTKKVLLLFRNFIFDLDFGGTVILHMPLCT